MQKITPFLWLDKDAKGAAEFYTSVFKDSKILNTTIVENTPSGTIEIVDIELMGLGFTLMAAGPLFKFNESVSFLINCKDQKEVDYYWEKLTADDGEESQCGWLKDKYGLSWQVIPERLTELTSDPDKEKAGRAVQAMLKMKKIIVADIEKAAEQG